VSRLPTAAEIRESGELRRLLEAYWRAVDDGAPRSEAAFLRFWVLVSAVYEQSYEKKCGSAAPPDGWRKTGWKLLSDRSIGANAVSYVWKAATNDAISLLRHEAVVRRGEESAAVDPTLEAATEADEDALLTALRAVLAGLPSDARDEVLEYYMPGGAEALARKNLRLVPRIQRGPRVGEKRTQAQAAESVQKSVQRIRDLIGAEVYERVGVAPREKAGPVSRSRTADSSDPGDV
jgi:hypothetical protein